MRNNKRLKLLFVLFLCLIFLAIVFFIKTGEVRIKYVLNINNIKNIEEAEAVEEVHKKTTPPDYVRGIYLTAYSANRDDWRAGLIEKMKEGRINAVVIDIKDYTGYVLYDSNLEELNKLGNVKAQMNDVKKIIEEFHAAGIYVIARQTVFQDPILVKKRPELAVKNTSGGTWYNYSGLAWSDPKNKEVWDYNILIAKEASSLGFDEINFDYIRYPSDGNLKTLNLGLPEGKTKADVLKDFFAYLSLNLTEEVNISADMFGLVMDNVERGYDLGIGQRLVDAVDYFDFICPMMYPSHYSAGYMGFQNPADHPGAVVANGIKLSGDIFEGRRASLRPWLQAFSIGAVYDRAKINAQADAVEAATSTGWLLWNARNYYPDFIF